MQKILTVSIAAYNVEEYIEKALNNFLNESIVDELEIFVINDGGTDSTLEIAEKYKKMYPNTFKLVYKENGGWGSTVNYGIQHATGKYFKQLDGDDFFLKSTLPKFINLLKNIECDLIYTPYSVFENGSNKIIEKKGLVSEYELMRKYNINELQKSFPLNMHSCTFRTSVLKNNVSIFEKCFYTDVEYMLKALVNVQTVIFTDIEIYQYRVAREGQSMSLEGIRKHYKEHEKVIVTLLEYFSKTVFRDTVKQMFQIRVSEMIDSQYMIYLYLPPSKQHKREIISFDKLIKTKYPEFYETNVARIRLLRKTHFEGYGIVARNTIKNYNNKYDISQTN